MHLYSRDGDAIDNSSLNVESPEELFALLYPELKKLAQYNLRRLPPLATLQPTALVHDAYLRLVHQEPPVWRNRQHFKAIASRVMHNILIDALRQKCAVKRGAGMKRVTLTDFHQPAQILGPEERLTLDDALVRLEHDYPEVAQTVLLRCLGGFTMDEIAHLCAVSKRTVERWWRFARAWLQSALAPI